MPGRCVPKPSRSRTPEATDRSQICHFVRKSTGEGKSSRRGPCSVNFGREAPKFRFEFPVDFLVDFSLLLFPTKKARKNPQKNPPQNSPGTLFGKTPLGFLQKPFLENRCRSFVAPVQKCGINLLQRDSLAPVQHLRWAKSSHNR